MLSLKRMVKANYQWLAHLIGRMSGRYYVEDYVRVYPEQIAFSRLGRRRQARDDEVRNYLNHCKFYRFASQFVPGKSVVDVGCGSGYGCALLANSGSREVYGCDISRQALRFAKQRYGTIAQFSEQGITDLRLYADSAFDVTISSEVLEHIKEYGLAGRAVEELKRITATGGIVVVGTPNSELLGDHGFFYDEIRNLFSAKFKSFVVFENALVSLSDQTGNVGKGGSPQGIRASW